MIKRNTYPAIALMLLLAALLSSCGGNANTPAATQGAPTATTISASAPTTAAQVVDTPTSAPAESAATAQQPKGGEASTPTSGEVASGPTAEATYVATTVAGEQPTATAPAGGAPGASGLVADLGFRPETNGFSFENYGGDTGRINLIADDLRRMFGDAVCGSTAGGKCILTPPAQQWMDEVNKGMGGGHCEGFAALSLVFYENKEKPDQFGAPQTSKLQIDGNAALQREIAYYFATQATVPTASNEIKGKTPSELLDILVNAYKNGAASGETYTMGIYQPGFKGGHAITPYAVEDKGNGVFAVLVYDNNYPGIARNVMIDRNANIWSYEASTNPNEPSSLYKGDATTGTLSITPTSPRLMTQVCSFCAQAGGYAPGAKQQAPAQEYNQVWLDGDGRMLLTDKAGHNTGLVNGKMVNDIPGVYFQTVRSSDLWKDSESPTFFVPLGTEYTVTLDGSDLTKASQSSLTMIGPGYDLSVDNVTLDPGQKDTINFSPDGKTVKYKTDYNESPDIELGIDGVNADYSFLVKGVDIESGGTMTLGIDTDKGLLAINTAGNKQEGTYSLVMDRIDDKGEQTFGHHDIKLQPDSTAYLDYQSWKGDGSDISLEVDKGNDGTIDDTLPLSDEP